MAGQRSAGPKEFALLIGFPGAAPLPQLLTESFCEGMLTPRLPLGLPPKLSPVSGIRNTAAGASGRFSEARVVYRDGLGYLD